MCVFLTSFLVLLIFSFFSNNAYAGPQKCLLKDEKDALDTFMSDWRDFIFTQFYPEVRDPIFNAYKELAKLPGCENLKSFVKMPNLVDTYTGSMAAKAPDLAEMEEMYKTEGFTKKISNNLFKNYVLPFPKNILIPTNTYSNKEYDFSIEYPMGWVVNDTKTNSTDTIVSFNFSMVGEDYSDAYLEVYLDTTSNRTNLHEKEYLNNLIDQEKTWCKSLTLKTDGYICTNFVLKNSKVMEIGGKKAYQSEYSWTDSEGGGSNLMISSETEIPTENKIWGVYTESIYDIYPSTIHQFRAAIESFRFDKKSASLPVAETASSFDIPSWIKNNAKWWADGSINDTDFTKGIQFLIKEGIIKIPKTDNSLAQQNQKIPDWVKNNAKWWSDDQISDNDFVKGIQYLVEHGIITV